MKENVKRMLLILLSNMISAASMTIIYATAFHFDGIIIHTLLYMCLVYTIMILTKKTKFSYIFINVLEWLFGIISILKIETRGQEFVPCDLSLIGNFFELASFTQITHEIVFDIIAQTFLIIAITILQIYVFEKYCEIPKRSGKIFIISLSIVAFLFFSLKYKMINMKYIVIERKGFMSTGVQGGLNRYGAFYNFIINVGAAKVYEIDDYSKNRIKDINEQYKNYNIKATQEYDNVIMILMESFVDFEEILNEDFKDDIIPNYHKYAQKYTNDKMKVDVIGGGTANIEYQALTMHSIEYYPEGIFPYMHYIKEDIDAFPKVFKENGYDTTAIHTYKEGFYNRQEVFERIGFDKYISDDDFINPKYYGEYIDDMEIYNEIVKLIENEEKSFIHAITMGAHSPYYGYPCYDEEDILKEEKHGKYATAINNYLYSLKRTDEMLGKLVEYVENSNEKTLLIVYGDHFPLLTRCLEDLKLIEKNEKSIDIEKYSELYETPYMIVSNIEKNIESRGTIKANEIGMYILENVKLEKLPWIYKIFYKYFEDVELKENYEIIQYDELHGEKYWKGI